ncbi:MAG: carbohydrate ABC transporter permease [Clostridiales bacterium]|nr:carbohydrate ABC transporter permease [Clostridiales bacterium]
MSAVMEKRAGARIARALNIMLLALVSLICLLPFVHMIAKSFSGAAAVSAGRVTFYPIDFTLNTYRYVLQDSLFFSSFRNSVIITVGGTLLSLTFTVLAAYPLSKQHLRGRRVILLLYVFTMLFYGGMVSIYVFMRTLNLLNTLACQIIPLLVSQYNLFVMKTFFEGIPESIEESAHIDGAGPLRTLVSIVLPLSLPSLATIGLFYAVAYWNNYYHPMLFITRADVKPLQMYLYELITTTQNLYEVDPVIAAGLSSSGMQAAAIVVSTLPILLVYPFLQKYFIKGLTVGSVKG